MSPEKYKLAWKEFQDKMDTLDYKRTEVLLRISSKLDKQRIYTLINKIKDHE